MWELVKELAIWTGWFPITIGAVIVMLLGKYFYDRESNFKEAQIKKLKDDLEDSKQYRVDVLVSSLDERVSIANRELERLREDKNSSQQEIASKEEEISSAKNEIRDLRAQLQKYEEHLDNLLDNELDYCTLCDVDDERIMMNVILWDYVKNGLVGDTALVKKTGTCSYCGGTNIKCQVCESITGIYDHVRHTVECEGGCGNYYKVIPEVIEKSTIYKVKVSRTEDE